MHGNAVTAARTLALLIFLSARGTAADVRLRNGAAPPATAQVTQQAAAVAPVAKTQGLGKTARVESAKQVVAQVASQPVKVAPSSTLTASLSSPIVPRRAQIEAELREAEDQAQSKVKELKVQAGLAKERQDEATQAQQHASELRERASKLRQEADVSAKIAKEKSDDAAKEATEAKATEAKVKILLSEEGEMQHVMNQTQKEELSLERNISGLKLQEAKMKPVVNGTAFVDDGNVTAPGASLAPKAAQMNQEAMQKLVEENNRLKHEKAELERQLSDRKVAKEKAKLKQKLKNRLALADRHMKLRKHSLRAHKSSLF